MLNVVVVNVKDRASWPDSAVRFECDLGDGRVALVVPKGREEAGASLDCVHLALNLRLGIEQNVMDCLSRNGLNAKPKSKPKAAAKKPAAKPKPKPAKKKPAKKK